MPGTPTKRQFDGMSKVVVSVKWGKETFNDIECDLESPPLVFKSQLFALTSVLPER
jgi:ubiquitin carboxyl-terminal hydrolase 14